MLNAISHQNLLRTRYVSNYAVIFDVCISVLDTNFSRFYLYFFLFFPILEFYCMMLLLIYNHSKCQILIRTYDFISWRLKIIYDKKHISTYIRSYILYMAHIWKSVLNKLSVENYLGLSLSLAMLKYISEYFIIETLILLGRKNF